MPRIIFDVFTVGSLTIPHHDKICCKPEQTFSPFQSESIMLVILIVFKILAFTSLRISHQFEKTNDVVFEQVRRKLVCTITEDG